MYNHQDYTDTSPYTKWKIHLQNQSILQVWDLREKRRISKQRETNPDKWLSSFKVVVIIIFLPFCLLFFFKVCTNSGSTGYSDFKIPNLISNTWVTTPIVGMGENIRITKQVRYLIKSLGENFENHCKISGIFLLQRMLS